MILRSLRLIGEKARGATLTTAEQAECLASFNAMLESWSIERLACYQVIQESFGLTASTTAYSIGTNGSFATNRPTRIVDPCFVRDSSNVDTKLELINVDAYGSIPMKSGSTGYPRYLYYDQGFSSTSTATINIYPPPQANLTLFINSVKQLGSVSTISTNVSFPPGYERALVFNYAIEEAGGLTSVAPEVAKIAKESKALIKTLNLPSTVMELDYGAVLSGRSRGNILEGP